MIKDKIDKLQSNDEEGKKEILIMIKNAFFQSMIEMFYDYMNYLSVIDGYPIFNINTLIENRPSKDARFYKEISETQMFLMFIQNMTNDEQSSIFNSKIKQYHFPKDLLKKYNAINRDFQEYYLSQTKIQKESLIKPFFINTDSLTGNDIKNEILTLSNKKYPFPEQKSNAKGILDEKCRITGNLLMLDQKENLPTYFYNTIPELEINTKIIQKANKVFAKADIFEKREKKNKNKHNYILVKGKRVWELTEEEKEDIRDNIKDILSRALKSEKLQVLDDMKHLMELIDKNFGREFFINSIYQKSKVPSQTLKIISDDCFELLSPVIFNGLLGILKLEENVQNYKNAILLIKATMLYYRVENKRKIFISEEILPKLKDYSLLVKYSFWEEWINLTVEETCDSERIKKDVSFYEHNIHKIILEITILMIQIGLVKDVIFKITTDLAENKITNKDLLTSLNSQIERLILSK